MIYSSVFRIYLLRHARANPAKAGQRDFERTLDQRGRDEAAAVSRLAADRNYRPDAILTSTAVRCRQTTEIFRGAFTGLPEPVLVDGLYDAAADAYLHVLSGLEEGASVLLAGHNPAIGDLLEILIGAELAAATLPAGYPTAGLAVVDRRDAGANWTLKDFLAP